MIQQLPNGRYKVTLDRGGRGADRKRITRTVDTHQQAEQVEAQLRGRPVSADGRTVLDVVDRYLHLHGTRLAPQTERGYHNLRDTYVAGSYLGAVHVDELDVDTLQLFYAAMQAGTWQPHAEPKSLNTAKAVHRLLSAAFNDVLRARDGLGNNAWGITWNPCSLARVIGDAPAPRAVADYDLADIGRALDAGGIDLADTVHLAIATGARKGELAGLRWRDVNLTGASVAYMGSISRGRRGSGQTFVRKLPKTNKPRRCALDAGTVAMLEARYRRQWVEAEAAGLDSLDDVAVLGIDLQRDYASPYTIGRRWQRACELAGVDLTLHDLRHVNTSEQMAGGVPVPLIAARNGWNSPHELLNTYAHARPATGNDVATAVLGNTWQQIEQSRKADQ